MRAQVHRMRNGRVSHRANFTWKRIFIFNQMTFKEMSNEKEIIVESCSSKNKSNRRGKCSLSLADESYDVMSEGGTDLLCFFHITAIRPSLKPFFCRWHV